VLEALPEPTKSIVTLKVVGSLRIGEVAALRWERIHPDRIEIVERSYEGEFDDTKTDGRRRSIPLDSPGILRAVLGYGLAEIEVPETGRSRIHQCKRRSGESAQFAASASEAQGQGLPESVDFRSFRTMHPRLISSIGVRPEVTRGNMGHATVDVTQNVLQPHVVGREVKL